MPQVARTVESRMGCGNPANLDESRDTLQDLSLSRFHRKVVLSIKLFVGMDVSSLTLDVCFLDSDDQILKQCSLPNDLHGASRIKELIIEYHQKVPYESILVGIESTSVYNFHPAAFFNEDSELKELGVQVLVQNPKSIARFKGLFDEDKTDKVDAFRIADFLRFDRFNLSLVKEEKYLALQRLTRSRYQLIQQMTECKKHFLETLHYKCKTLTWDVDPSVFGSAMIDLPSESLSLDDIAAMPTEDLTEVLHHKARRRFADPLKLAKAIHKAASDSYRLGKVMQDSIDMVLGSYALMIRTSKEQIKSFGSAIERLLEAIPESQCLLSIPGIGTV